jgi:hypothetical protein
VTTTGPAHAPEEPAELPENRKPIPPPSDTNLDPESIDDGAFGEALKNAGPALVMINLAENRKAIGFLVAGKDKEHAVVVTNFFSVARRNYTAQFWVDIRQGDGTKFEAEGLQNYDESQDVALISVKLPQGRKTKLLELADADPKAGQKAYAVGLPQSWIDWAAPGKVLKIEDGQSVGAPAETKWVSTDAVVSETNRGGPLVNDQSKVIGLCTWGGKGGRGPFLSAPVSKIRELLGREVGSGRFVEPQGAFRWPESKTKKTETFDAARIQALALSLKRTLDCTKCKGYGYLVTPVYTLDPRTGQQTKTSDKNTVCEECGGAGVFIRTGIQDLLSTAGRALLSPDDKVADEELAKARAAMQEGFDRAAVNRLVLADKLTPTANKLLADVDKNRGEAVAFIAVTGPSFKSSHDQRTFLFVKPYDSDLWILTYGADARLATAYSVGSQTPSRSTQPLSSTGRGTYQYALVVGILEGYTTGIEQSGKKVYRAPLLHAADIVLLRP